MGSRAKTISNILLFMLSLLLGVLIAWQMKNLNFMEGINLFGSTDQVALQEEIAQLQVANQELIRRNAGLTENIQELAEIGSSDDARLNYYQNEVERLATFAGLTDVRGPGAIISLDTSAEGAYVDPASLLSVINGLKANGAYAISVNGERIVSMTEVIGTGSENQNIVINGTNVTSNVGYEIRIIGEVRKIQDFYSFQTNTWTRLQSRGVVVQLHTPNEVDIAGLAEDSPAYRQNLLETIEDYEITE